MKERGREIKKRGKEIERERARKGFNQLSFKTLQRANVKGSKEEKKTFF